MNQPQLRILDMESSLADDDQGAFRDSVCDTFREEMQSVKRTMDQGLAPDEFERAQKYAKALETATTVVETLWKLEHKK